MAQGNNTNRNSILIPAFLTLAFLLHYGKSAGQDADIIGPQKIDSLINAKDKQIAVINFWATWCGPCIKELPLFEAFRSKGSNVRVVLISVDLDLDPDPKKVWKFIRQRKMTGEIYMLKTEEANNWIANVDSAWTGALPATLVINHANGKRKFIEGELSVGELEKITTEIK